MQDGFRIGQAAEALGRREIDVGLLLNIYHYELVLQSQLLTNALRTQHLQAEIQRRRELLVAADQQVQVLEKLRDRQRALHLQTESRRDVKILDDVASTALLANKTGNIHGHRPW